MYISTLLSQAICGCPFPPFPTDEEVSAVANCLAGTFGKASVMKFYIHLHDYVVKELAFLEHEDHCDRFLEMISRSFVESPAKQGGCSLFGIVDTESQSLLAAFFEPFCELRISSFELAN